MYTVVSIFTNILGHCQVVSHFLVDKRRQSSITVIPSVRRADSGTDYYLVVVTLQKRLSVKKGIKQ